ncbi:MAG: FMN-binding protein [Tissierellia bacterium]|nr:FMN-binding protein [Tissierellia bacterium]
MKNLLIVLLILMLSIVGCSSDERIKTNTEASKGIENNTILSSENINQETEDNNKENISEEQQTEVQQHVEQKPEKPVEQKPEKPVEQESETTEESEKEQTLAPADEPEEIISQSEEYITTEPEQTPPSEEPEEINSHSIEYTGEDRGIGGPIIVSVTLQDDKITQIEIISHNETKGVSENAIDTIISSIIENQTTDVDAVSGATITSKALMNAVKNALEKKE